METNNKVLISFLKEYEVWNNTGFKTIGKDIKIPTYDYYNMLAKSEDGSYIKNINENFKNNTLQTLPPMEHVLEKSEDNIRTILSRLYLIDDEYVYDFRNSITKLYTYGIGYNEPEKTIDYIDEPIPEKVQIVSPVPLIVRHEDNDKILDIKFIANPYGAYKLNLNPGNAIKTLQPTAEFFKSAIDTLTGIGDTSRDFYFAATRKLGNVDKKDTGQLTDKYALTKIEKIYLSYVTEDEEGYLLKDKNTDTVLRRLDWKGNILPDEVIDIQTFNYYNDLVIENQVTEGQVYIITVKNKDRNLNIREIKVLPKIIQSLKTKLQDIRIKYGEFEISDIVNTNETNNMKGLYVYHQPFCNMGDDTIINLTQDSNGVITDVGITYDFNKCNIKISDYFNSNYILRINNKFFNITSINKKTYGTLSELLSNKIDSDNETEILLTKLTPSTNSVYFVTLEKNENNLLMNFYLTNKIKYEINLTEDFNAHNEYLDLIINIELNKIEKDKKYFGSCDSVAMFNNIKLINNIDGSYSSSAFPIKSDIPGAKFYNDNMFNTVVIDI